MISTALTRMFELSYPIVLGPMGSVSGGALAAAVSNAGGLGLVGGGYGDPAWLRRELSIVSGAAKRPWGVGLITWAIKREALDLALSHRPAAFMLSFGDPRPWAPAIKAAGCRLICQVQSLADARIARDAGADLVVAQGTEAGGHGGQRATLPLVPAVIDGVAPLPVVAAGGIADGRGLAAMIALGASGALIGTRFYASTEALADAKAKARIVAGDGGDTVRTSVFDVVRGYPWPEPFTGRALRNGFVGRWHGREDLLRAALDDERPRFRAAVASGDFDTVMVWAGEAVDLIRGVEGAGEIVSGIGADAEARLQRAAALVDSPQGATSPAASGAAAASAT